MYKFDSDSFIAEMESLEGIKKTKIDNKEIKQEEYEKINERDLKGDM